MKHYFFILSFLVLSISFTYGQDNKLIYSKKTVKSEEKSKDILQKSPAYLSVDFVEIDLDKILLSDEYTLEFDNKKSVVKKEKINTRGIKNFTLFCSNFDADEMIISILDDDIQGIIHKGDNVYSIETVGINEYAVIKTDQSALKEACQDFVGTLEDNVYNSIIEDNSTVDYEIETTNQSTSNFTSTTSSSPCKIRVLILYTPDARSSISNIKNTALLGIDITNQSFANSNIYYELELVYIDEINYVELTGDAYLDNWSTDLGRFRSTNDGYMDEVHTLRNKYSADICVLFYNGAGYCGLAYLGVPASYAFCLVKPSSGCMGKYTFSHEIGHLIGCRHDTYVDNSTTPFAYGHGYTHIGTNSTNSWRTIMAYDDYCIACGVSCLRKLYWANPNVSFNGIPTGTVVTNNTARVWNEESDRIMAFRQPENNLTFTSGDLSNSTYADIVAKQNITTSGTITISNGSTLNFRAGNNIVLSPGFSIEAGAEFSANIETISDCGSATKTKSAMVIIENAPQDNTTEISIDEIVDFSYKIYPNPSNDFIMVNYIIDTEIPFSIDLVNILGQKIKTILPRKSQNTGNHTVQVSVSELSTGTYFLVISSGKQIKTEKIIINK